MNVNGRPFRTIWPHPSEESVVCIIDQRQLPHRFVIEELRRVDDFETAIRDMHVRGAGLIGATAAYGMFVAACEAPRDNFSRFVSTAARRLKATRPTAVNLAWAVDLQLEAMACVRGIGKKISTARETARQVADGDADCCRRIGEHGRGLIRAATRKKNGGTVNILTHCNAGWLAFVDHGSALAPVYAAHDAGIAVHVWVDETRPRCQGSKLTAWELGRHGVPHTIIADNAGGHLMQHGLVDLVIVGTDRTTRTGDVANKIGTYLKALAARDNRVPFYVALPSSSFDWSMRDGVREIPIEERGSEEVKYADGTRNGKEGRVLLAPAESPAANYGFDVTPARLVTSLITERGICRADEAAILLLFPERREPGNSEAAARRGSGQARPARR